MLAILCLGAVNAQDNSTCDIEADENFEELTPVCEVNDDLQTDIDDNILDTSAEEAVDEVKSDNVTVDVSNVFEGQNATIYVTAPEATGTVNITVGENMYTPEFVGGVATQSISEYSIGLNNVTVKYNDIVKETSFKVLDGVITNETVLDYLEIYSYYYVLASYVPEGATLDFRGNVFIERIGGKTQSIQIDKSLNFLI